MGGFLLYFGFVGGERWREGEKGAEMRGTAFLLCFEGYLWPGGLFAVFVADFGLVAEKKKGEIKWHV
jgi:hypothetical protein